MTERSTIRKVTGTGELMQLIHWNKH